MTIILTYHDVVARERRDSVGFCGRTAGRYKLPPAAFEEHLARIAATGVEIGLVDPSRPLPRASLTFDDGGESALDVAGALERYGWRGHFFVITSKIGSPGFLGEEEIGELARRGHRIGSHSHTHPTYMGRLDRAALDAEWRESQAILGSILGAPPELAAVPGGFVAPPVIESAARAGYGILMTSEPHARTRRVGPLLVLGRYAVWATTPAATAAAYARGAIIPRWRLWLEWRAKTTAKRISPALYEHGRRGRAIAG